MFPSTVISSELICDPPTTTRFTSRHNGGRPITRVRQLRVGPTAQTASIAGVSVRTTFTQMMVGQRIGYTSSTLRWSTNLTLVGEPILKVSFPQLALPKG